MVTDLTRSGSPTWKLGEWRRVTTWVSAHPGAHTNEEVCEATRTAGRTVRSILSAADGREFVTLAEDAGIGIAAWADEAEEGTRRLESQIREMQARVERRRAWLAANPLPRRQGRFD